MDNKIKLRSEIAEKDKWDLISMYSSIKSWQDDFKKIETLLKYLKENKNFMDSAINLNKVLNNWENLDLLHGNLYIYAVMKYHEDTTNNESMKIKGQIEKIGPIINESSAIIRNEILKADYAVVEKYMSELSALKKYKFFFEKLFRQKEHILSDKEELLIAGMSEIFSSSSNIYDVIHDTDLKYKKVSIDNEKIEIRNSNFVKLQKLNNQVDRKKVFKGYYEAYKNMKNTFATTIKYNIKALTFIAKVRKYQNPLDMELYNDKIDVNVYDNLIKTVNSNLDILHKYISLRKKELNLKELHMYDIYASITGADSKKYSYEEAKTIVKAALKPLGSEYLKVLDKAFEERWIDIYNNANKHSGAYSWGTYTSKPYVLLNFEGTLYDIFILAHELGHSIHSYYSNKNQPSIYASYSIFVAEVASTVNEMLLSKYLINNVADNKQKKILLNELMESFKATLYRQTMFAEFEKIVFEKEQNNEVITEELLSTLYYDLNKKYYGNEIIHDDEIRYEWMRIPHFYNSFYVYKYATGISAACAIVNKILSGDKKHVNNYLKFLASGGSDYPIELLKIAGVNMSAKEPIENAIKIFDETINQYIDLTKKK